MSLNWRASATLPPNQTAVRRLVVAGGFGAGKSTAINLLMRSHVCPVSVVARLRPVVHLHQTNARPVGVSQIETPFSSDQFIHAPLPALSGLLVTELQADRVEDVEETVLAHVEQADELVWCTIASQAWRQSERLTFDAIRKVHQGPAYLVVTRADLLRSPEDQEKIRLRLDREAGNLFEAITFVGAPETTLEQLAARDIWHATGAAQLSQVLGIGGTEALPPVVEALRPVLIEADAPAEPNEIDEKSNPHVSEALNPEASKETAASAIDAFAPPPDAEEITPFPVEEETVSPPEANETAPVSEPEVPAPSLEVSDDIPVQEVNISTLDGMSDRIASLAGFDGLVVFHPSSANVVCGTRLSETEMDDLAVFSALLLAPHDDEPIEEAAILGKASFVVVLPLPGRGNEAVAARFVSEVAAYATTRLAMVGIVAPERKRSSKAQKTPQK